MVTKALTEFNRIAKIQHATLQGKITVPTEQELDVRNNMSCQFIFAYTIFIVE